MSFLLIGKTFGFGTTNRLFSFHFGDYNESTRGRRRELAVNADNYYIYIYIFHWRMSKVKISTHAVLWCSNVETIFSGFFNFFWFCIFRDRKSRQNELKRRTRRKKIKKKRKVCGSLPLLRNVGNIGLGSLFKAWRLLKDVLMTYNNRRL